MTIPYGSLAITVDVTIIIEVASHALGETPETLTGQSRGDRTVSLHRHIAMAAARRLGHSYPAIGRAFGDRDHTTVIPAVRKVEATPELAERARIIAEEATMPRSLF